MRYINSLYFFLASRFIEAFELVVMSLKPQPDRGPWRLVTVNTAPERAKRLIGQMIERVKDSYTIIHSANVEGTLVMLPRGIPSLTKAA